MVMDLTFWKGKRVFVTGHTGFKGTWLCYILLNAGADVTGYALPPPTEPSLFGVCDMDGTEGLNSIIGDIRDREKLLKAFLEARPEIAFHMAAQPIVRESYKNPADTYEINVMGTVNVLECLRIHKKTRSFLNVTTDKVYENMEWEWGYRESDALDGRDPYSNSKSCSELVTHSYRRSFFAEGEDGPAISTARAGNVIGGGDFAADRILPDCIRAVRRGEPIVVRNPHSTRPYQHVLEPLFAYLMIAEKQYQDDRYEGCYNVGPDDRDCVTTANLADLFCTCWGDGAKWQDKDSGGPHEANFLKLDCARLKTVFGWQPRWTIEKTVAETVRWTKAYLNGEEVRSIMDEQVAGYLGMGKMA
jgi:CDP-glucose 4,6-dehydratase